MCYSPILTTVIKDVSAAKNSPTWLGFRELNMAVKYDYPTFDNMSLVLHILNNALKPLISAIS